LKSRVDVRMMKLDVVVVVAVVTVLVTFT